MPSAPPIVLFDVPHPDLRPFVTSYYFADARGPLDDHLHPEWGNIRFVLRGDWHIVKAGRRLTAPVAGLYGPTDRTSAFGTPDGTMLGVGLTPLGWVRLIRTDASRLANAVVALGDHLGADGVALAHALAADDRAARVARLDAVLRAHLATSIDPGPGVAAVQEAILDDGIVDVGALAARVGVAERSLQRLCLDVFGFGPKRLLRRQRFLRTLARLRDRLGEPVAGLVDAGYCDQAHFTREFRTYMGMSPTAYYASPREAMRRAADERLRVIGAPLQGLHRDPAGSPRQTA